MAHWEEKLKQLCQEDPSTFSGIQEILETLLHVPEEKRKDKLFEIFTGYQKILDAFVELACLIPKTQPKGTAEESGPIMEPHQRLPKESQTEKKTEQLEGGSTEVPKILEKKKSLKRKRVLGPEPTPTICLSVPDIIGHLEGEGIHLRNFRLVSGIDISLRVGPVLASIEPCHFHKGRIILLNLTVDENKRRQGLGSSFIEQFKQEIKGKFCIEVHRIVNPIMVDILLTAGFSYNTRDLVAHFPCPK